MPGHSIITSEQLDRAARPRWPAAGLKTSAVIGNKHPVVEALLEEPALRADVVQELSKGDGWT